MWLWDYWICGWTIVTTLQLHGFSPVSQLPTQIAAAPISGQVSYLQPAHKVVRSGTCSDWTALIIYAHFTFSCVFAGSFMSLYCFPTFTETACSLSFLLAFYLHVEHPCDDIVVAPVIETTHQLPPNPRRSWGILHPSPILRVYQTL